MAPCESIPWFDALAIDTDYEEYLQSFADDNESVLPERTIRPPAIKTTHNTTGSTLGN